ncbi:hypothetical protein ACI3LY_002376 [Candidozyma auris]|uniref:Uncharacterized protein n=2 Tax=Candidozyma auris TaxID=498019 RepID=A0A2H0ZLI8_CANAR|nr:hypothetical protein QG37_05217 [[Candida] auris]PIS51484.1 hypothetical protein B9J08_003070 [[Candida] auris]QWW22147.1 hypothetical protein CA7LBN_000893 [[Candida] auris]
MNNVGLALQVSLISQRNLVIQTTDYDDAVDLIRTAAHVNYDINDIVEVDLLALDAQFDGITDCMVKEDGSLYNFVILKNLECVHLDFEKKGSLLRVLNQLSRFDKVASRNMENEPLKFGKHIVYKPSLFALIPVIRNGNNMPAINPQIKSRFFFSQLYIPIANDTYNHQCTVDDILQARRRLSTVFVKATVEEYAHSLFVFTRSHRLCSLAPLTARPPLSARENVMVLAKALTFVKDTPQDGPLFVTPALIKVAFRKVAYWLVDWETNPLFNGEGESDDYRKKMEISMLTGDWFGSEWRYVENYLAKNTQTTDAHSTTGFTNPLVEDVLTSVQPPI